MDKYAFIVSVHKDNKTEAITICRAMTKINDIIYKKIYI